MSVGVKNRGVAPYQSDATSGAKFLSPVVPPGYREGGIVIDSAATHGGRNPNTTIRKGACMAKITATGKYKVFDPSGSGGQEIARGILNQDCDLKNTDGTAADFDRAALVINGWYVPANVTDKDGTDISASNVETRRNLFGLDGSAGTEAITGCQLNPVV
jgi:hypothetical protein